MMKTANQLWLKLTQYSRYLWSKLTQCGRYLRLKLTQYSRYLWSKLTQCGRYLRSTQYGRYLRSKLVQLWSGLTRSGQALSARVREWLGVLKVWMQKAWKEVASTKAGQVADVLRAWWRKLLYKWLDINRLTIASQLYLGIGFVVMMALIISAVSWLLFGRIGAAQSYVNERSVPQLVAAFGIAQRSAALVNAAPRLLTVSNEAMLKQVAASVEGQQALFIDQLARLVETHSTQEGAQVGLERIGQIGEMLIQNIEEIKQTVADRLKLNQTVALMRTELVGLQRSVTKVLVPEIDDQLYFTITGYRNLEDRRAPRSEYKSEDALLRYLRLASLQESASVGITLLSNVFDIESVPLLEPQRERFETVLGTIERDQFSTDTEASELAFSELARLFDLGYGEQGVFAVHRRGLELAEKQRLLFSQNRQFALNLVSQAESLAATTQEGADAANQSSEEAVALGATALIVLSAIMLVSAIVVSWLFVGRFLVTRLEFLSVRMRQMAEGDLSEEVHMVGHDEVADMAVALEVFRKSSLEARRVDVAEKLAAELSSKNEELESVLGDLKRAQTQIIMREKLAALGELTAGVAHEIKNPLNFIKNFSEMTGEIVDELKEVIEESGVTFSEDKQSLIDELTKELKGNADRVRNHSERANHIVRDMLSMGRGGGDRQMSDINALIDEHIRLAFHSARATDPNFQLHIEQELDSELGEVNVIPQDLGRLFLNLVGNSCYATDKRRRDILEAVEAGNVTKDEAAAYNPTLTVVSKKLKDSFQVVVKDNGCGIAEENVKKVFNPFFTTKPTDQGTGLGLALSSDIIRAHGGSIDVQSKVNEFTQMTVTIPLDQSAYADSGSGDDQAGDEQQKSVA